MEQLRREALTKDRGYVSSRKFLDHIAKELYSPSPKPDRFPPQTLIIYGGSLEDVRYVAGIVQEHLKGKTKVLISGEHPKHSRRSDYVADLDYLINEQRKSELPANRR